MIIKKKKKKMKYNWIPDDYHNNLKIIILFLVQVH